jgi:hypothetical protein
MWRKSLDSLVFKNANIWYFWSWCLMKATHKEYTAVVGYQKVALLPGQFIFGRNSASKELGLSVKQIRTAADWLKDCQNITLKTASKYSIITIVNWDTYQDNNCDEGQQRASKTPKNGQQMGQQMGQQNIEKILVNSTVCDNGLAQEGQQSGQQRGHQDVEKGPHTITTTIKTKDFFVEPPKSVHLFLSDSIEYRLGDFLFKHAKRNNPNFKKPDLQKWARTFDLMIRIDKRDPGHIRKVIEFCQKDSFWMTNILSAKKLRDKYDQLTLRMGTTPSGILPTTPGNGMQQFFAEDFL